VIDRLTALYHANADPLRAESMAAYMKDNFVYFGIPTPVRRALDRDVRTPSLDEAGVLALAQACWAVPEREYQYFACDELRRHAEQLSADALPAVEALITSKSWWDTVDALTWNVDDLVARHPHLRAEMDRWLTGDDMWLARVAILHQMRRKASTDVDWLFAACLTHAHDTRFFLRKAIGWALREYSKTDADAVIRFVADHDAELSGLSKREALKWLARRAAASG
jgi:3-methyladenine DNA glycosylase AlkD